MRLFSACLRTARSALRRFRKHRRGSAALEFAMVAPIFFALMFAIIETALVFFAGQVLETGTQDIARLILTNQAQNGSGACQSDGKPPDQEKFKQCLCSYVNLLFSCDALVVSVRAYPEGTLVPSSDLANPITNGTFVNNAVYQLDTASPGSTVLIRTFYQWPLFVTGLGYNIANIGSGLDSKRLLTASAAFVVEPGAN